MMSAGAAAIWVATCFLLLCAGMGFPPRRREAAQPIAKFSVLAAALFCTLALLILAHGLWSGDLGSAFVARHTTSAQSPLWRLVAVWAEPGGAALVTAVPTLVLGWWSIRNSRSARSSAAVAAAGLVLLTATLAGSPFPVTDFTPAEGLGLTSGFEHPLVVVTRLAMSMSVAAATVTLARTVDGGAPRRAPAWTAALVTCSVLLAWESGLRTGTSRVASLPAMWNGQAAILVVSAVIAWLVCESRRATITARLCASLGLLSGSLAMLVSKPGTSVGLVLAVMAGFLAAPGIRFARLGADRWRNRRTWTASGIALIAGAAAMAVAVVGDSRSSAVRLRLAGGSEALVEGTRLRVGHQGVSRFESEGSHIVAVALSVRDGSSETLASAGQLDVVNARDEHVATVPRPASVWLPARGGRVLIWLDETLDADAVVLHVRVAPLAMFWPFAAVLFLAGFFARSRTVPVDTPTCAVCGQAVAGNYCSTCGAATGA